MVKKILNSSYTKALGNRIAAKFNFLADDFTILVSGYSMAPGLQSGDLAVIRPAEGFNGEGLSLMSLLGSEMLRRVFQTAVGRYPANCDNRDHYPGYSAVERVLAWSGCRD